MNNIFQAGKYINDRKFVGKKISLSLAEQGATESKGNGEGSVPKALMASDLQHPLRKRV